MRPAGWASGLVLALVARAALAWPVEWQHDVEPGKEKFIRLAKVDWLEVEKPELLEVEWLAESGELLLVGKKPGATLVMLAAESKVAVWRVRVGSPPRVDASALERARKACPGLQATPLEEVKLTVSIASAGCRQALKALFETDAYRSTELELTFEAPVLQQQLQEVQAAADKVGTVQARYVGAGLVLEGAVPGEAARRQLLWALFRISVGRMALDDRLTAASPPDAGRAPTPAGTPGRRSR